MTDQPTTKSGPAYENHPEQNPETVPTATKPVETEVHGFPESQQPSEGAIAVDLPTSIPTVQIDTALPQSQGTVVPQDPYGTDDPAILPKDLNPQIVPAPNTEPAPPAVPTSETHIAGHPAVELPRETEDRG